MSFYVNLEPVMWKAVYVELVDQWWAVRPLTHEDNAGHGYTAYTFANKEEAEKFAAEANEAEGLPKKWTITDSGWEGER